MMLIQDKVDAVLIPDSPSHIKADDYNQIKNEIQECIVLAGMEPKKDVIQLPDALKTLTQQSGAEEMAKIKATGDAQLAAVNALGQEHAERLEQARTEGVEEIQQTAEGYLDHITAVYKGETKADVDLKNTGMLTNCIIGAKNNTLHYTLGQKANYIIVGKPVISASQVVSGITSADRVYAEITSPVPSENFLVEGEVLTPSSWGGIQALLALKNANNVGLVCRVTAGGTVEMFLSGNGTSWNICNPVTSTYVLPVDTRVQFKLFWNKYQYSFMVRPEGDADYKVISFQDSSLPLCALSTIYFGTDVGGEPFKGSVYLDKFSVSVDGERVLDSSNALAQKNAVISPAGIASGFDYGTGSQIVLDQSDVVPETSFEFCTKFKLGDALRNFQMICDSLNGVTFEFAVGANGDIYAWVGNGASFNILSEASFGYRLIVDKWYWIKFLWTGDIWTVFVSEDGESWTSKKCYSNSTQPLVVKTSVTLGYDKGVGHSVGSGEIDLAATYIKADGAVISGANFFNSGVSVDNGVVSGFAPESRLHMDRKLAAPSKNFVYQFKFHTPQSWNARSRQFFLGQETSGLATFLLYISSAGIPYGYMQTGLGGNWNIMSGYEFRSNGRQFVLPTDSDVWLKFIWDGTGYIAQISTDGITFYSSRRLAQAAHHNTMAPILGSQHWGNTEFFDGAIDLKETFFKVDGTYQFNGANLITLNDAKIENGVLSFPVAQNLNGAFYPNRTPAETANSWEVIVNVRTPGSAYVSGDMCILGTTQTAHPKMAFNSGKLRLVYANSVVIDGTTAVLPDSDYWAAFKFNGANYELYLLQDDGSFTLDTLPDFSAWSKEGPTYTNATDIFKGVCFSFGYSWEDNMYLKGSINLAKTRIKRNGEVFWQWNGKDGDNVDLIDYQDGWVFNGKPEQNQYELSGEKAWEWNGVSSLAPGLADGRVWSLLPPVPGTIAIKEGLSALIKQGYTDGGTLQNLHQVFEADRDVIIPHEQTADKILYLNEDGEPAFVDTKHWNTVDKGAPLARFWLEDYVIQAVTPERVVELAKTSSLRDEIVEEGFVDNPSGSDAYGKVKFTRFKSGRLRLQGRGITVFTFPIPFAAVPDTVCITPFQRWGDYENTYFACDGTTIHQYDKYERGGVISFLVEGMELK